MNFLTDLELAEAVLADVVGFAQGKAVAASPTIGGVKYSVTLQVLTSGPVAPFQEFTGGIFSELVLGLTLGTEVAAGQPAQVAMKVGSTWYGLTLNKAS